MKQDLVREKQVFGKVISTPMHASTLKTPDDHPYKSLGGASMNGNNGRTHGPSFEDPNPGAYQYACRGRDNPFAFVGKSMPESRVNLTERQTNAI